MQVQIDRAGRIVLPKKLRQRLGLRSGAALTIEETADGLLLRPTGRQPALIEENGVLVHTGKLPANYDWSRLVEDEREERIRFIAGL